MEYGGGEAESGSGRKTMSRRMGGKGKEPESGRNGVSGKNRNGEPGKRGMGVTANGRKSEVQSFEF